MNLSNIYKIAYNGAEPFEEPNKKSGPFFFAAFIMGLLEEQENDNNEISFLDYYCYMLNETGLTLNDFEYALNKMVRHSEKYSYAIDLLLYHNCCENKLFDNFNKVRNIMPNFVNQRIKLEEANNIDEDHLSYSKLFLGLRSKEELCMVLDCDYNKQNKNFISTHQGKIFVKKIEAFYNLNDIQNDYINLLKQFIQKEKLTPSKIRAVVTKMLNECTSSKINYAREILKRTVKTKTLNKTRTVNGVTIKEQDNSEVSWKNVVKLPEFVIGQEDATKKVSEKLLASYIGFQSENQPVASFLLTGPTGVGKTETAKAVANLCFDDKLYVVDMTTFKSEADVSRLLGASPQYVGYGDTNSFCEFLEENPNCVLVFDEIDKCHKSCLDLLMRMLDEGEFINAKGKVVSLRNAVIFCTTNLTEYVEQDETNNENSQKAVEQKLTSKQGLRKEIVGRFHEVIEYKKLSKEACKTIAKKYFLDKLIKNFEQKNQKRGIKLDYTTSLLDKIVEDANTDLFGARDLKKSIQANFINPITKYIVENEPTNTCLLCSPKEVIDVEKNKTQSTEKNTHKENDWTK